MGIPLVKKTQFLSLLPVSSPFTHYQSWLSNLVAYLVGELLQERAGHASFQQTYQTYVHPSTEALRAAWEQTQEQVCLSSSVGGR